jgi:hypothetical protein
MVVVLVLLASATQQEALAVRSLGVPAPPSSSPDVLPTAARPDTPEKKRAAAAAPPSAVFDPDRMSKRRVRRGSDPIHNKC